MDGFASPCSDTVIGPVSSLMSPEISLLFKSNSLLQTVGNFEKSLGGCCGLWPRGKPNYVHNDVFPCIFPVDQGIAI
jgi:hypothetical protein